MSTTVREAILNAQINFDAVLRLNRSLGDHPIFTIAKGQLDNAVEALNNGMALDEVIQESLGSDVRTTP